MKKIYSKEIFHPQLNIYYRYLNNNILLTELHSHDFWEFFIVVKGVVNHNLNSSSVILDENSLVFIRPDDTHCFNIIENADNFFLNIAISSNLMEQLFSLCNFSQQSFLDYEQSLICHVQSTKISEWIDKLNQVDTLSSTNLLKSINLKIIVLDILFSFISTISTPFHIDNYPLWFRDFLFYINLPENLSLSINQLAEIQHYSLQKLNETFKKYFKSTFKQYQMQLRLKYAANLLINSDYDILNISLTVGYSSLSHFIKIFKNEYDFAPSIYRKNNYRLL